LVEALILRAKMDIRVPQANHGAGFKSQGCHRPWKIRQDQNGNPNARRENHSHCPA
jgi:hypothetical protein